MFKTEEESLPNLSNQICAEMTMCESIIENQTLRWCFTSLPHLFSLSSIKKSKEYVLSND